MKQKNVILLSISLDALLISLLAFYILVPNTSLIGYLLIISLLSLNGNILNLALGALYKSKVLSQEDATELQSALFTIFQISSAISPIIVGGIVQIYHQFYLVLLVVLALIIAQLFLFSSFPNISPTNNKTNDHRILDFREGFRAYKTLIKKDMLFLAFTLQPVFMAFVMGGSFYLVVSLLFGISSFAIKLAILEAFAQIGVIIGSFLAGIVKLKTGFQTYALFTIASLLNVFVALYPFYLIIVSLLTLAGLIAYIAQVNSYSYTFISIPSDVYARVSSLINLMRNTSGVAGTLLLTYLASIYKPDFIYFISTSLATFMSALMLLSSKIRRATLMKTSDS
ncbi:hypothetical protein B9Q02_00395 [Candidatus Marsarchaeota G1 archaeon BE_D]|uniref:Major facilitator superfamily (MFS) profile domain-containing protein n=3 Tax=Candidatus Marsarchaeota TaxID=1978152 RepID=A0A2R6AKI8_9ARCH|nr:MAG: hypothetical protein B9Q02_00395 [Candidatus Marsarchaeota G1 archaeon BE_D]PSN89559.1 MAG: hypothetical protein B9Q00_00795 [Candidatus Marsarchaeota G1 archaeon OSP_C]PSO03686.1 MAG: hypothetical protein B9Q10_00065 [Candidatus Marsarchaeota G2 archaeon ECH_B_SAG-E12]